MEFQYLREGTTALAGVKTFLIFDQDYVKVKDVYNTLSQTLKLNAPIYGITMNTNDDLWYKHKVSSFPTISVVEPNGSFVNHSSVQAFLKSYWKNTERI